MVYLKDRLCCYHPCHVLRSAGEAAWVSHQLKISDLYL